MFAWLNRLTYLQFMAVAVILLLIAVGTVRAVVSYGSCAWYGYQTDRETRYAAFVGCMVQVENRWVPRNELRLVQ